MKIRLLTIGTKMPDWVNIGYQTYARRLTQDVRLELIEMPTGKGSTPQQLIQQESQALLAACQPQAYRIALDVKGTGLSTPQLADRLQSWLQQGKPLNMLIGGPEGLSHECLHQMDFRWSLSPLTLPHPLVRVVLAEQIYRAWTLLKGHPYHKDNS